MPLYIKLRTNKRTLSEANHLSKECAKDMALPISRPAITMRRYRTNIKENQKMYEVKREEERIRSRVRRQTATEKQKATARVSSKLRMQRMRERRKMLADPPETPQQNQQMQPVAKKGTQELKDLREYNRKKKQQSRAKQSVQKRRREREKNRERVAMKRSAEGAKKEKKMDKRKQKDVARMSTGFPSDEARRQAVFRGKKGMPKSPNRYSEVLEKMMESERKQQMPLHNQRKSKESPKRKQLTSIFKCLREVKSALRKKVSSSQPRRNFLRSLVSRLKSKYKFKSRHLSRGLGISFEEVKNFSNVETDDTRKKRSDATEVPTVESVQAFLQQPDNAVELPHKKSVGSSLVPKRVAQMSQMKLFLKWKSENPERKLSFVKFNDIRIKTTTVKTQAHRALVQCLCEYCANIDHKLRAIHTISAKNKVSIQLRDRYELLNTTLCSHSSKYAPLDCIDRKCEDCGTKLLTDKLQPLAETLGRNMVSWYVWEYRESSLTKGKKRVLVKKAAPVQQLITDLNQDLEPYAAHLFHAHWQHDQYNSITSNIPKNTVVMVMDFSENFSCYYQEEIQAAHWAKNVITIHPIVAMYRCPEHDVPVREYLNFLTSDNLHDAHAVVGFVSQAVTHLREQRELKIERVVQFTDGAASQYKSKTPFCDISFAMKDLHATVERHFFGSRYGKGPCDGEGGVVKSAASRAIRNGQYVISDAASFHDFCQSELSKPPHCSGDRICDIKTFARTFYLIKEINHARPEREGTTINGTRLLHSVRGGYLSLGKLQVRRLSCFCPNCEEEQGQCQNRQYVTPNKTEVCVKELRDYSTEPEREVAHNKECERECDLTVGAEQMLTEENLEVGNTNYDQDSDHEAIPWKQGDWVVVKYNGQLYPGIAMRVIGKETEVDCMVNNGKFWKWPPQRDLLWYRQDSVRVIPPPCPATQTRGLLKFIDFEANEC